MGFENRDREYEKPVPVPFFWKPVSATSSAVQASDVRAQVDSIRPPSSSHALVMGACSQEAKERAESEFSGLDMRRSVLMALIDSL